MLQSFMIMVQTVHNDVIQHNICEMLVYNEWSVICVAASGQREVSEGGCLLVEAQGLKREMTAKEEGHPIQSV